MADAVRLPDVGTNVDEVKIVRWLKNPGEEVEIGEVLAELETDKAVVDLEATIEGFLIDIVIPEGEVAKKGDILAYIGEQDEKVEHEPSTARHESSSAEIEEKETIPETGQERKTLPGVKASPLVKNIARQRSINLSEIRGTGPGGRVMRADLLNHVTVSKQSVAEDTITSFESRAGTNELTSNQLRVAEKVSWSHREIPVVHFKARIDMTASIDFRDSGLSTLGGKPSFDSLFLYAVSRVLADFPLLHSTFKENRAIRGENIHIGFALGIGNDLFIPVIQNITKKSIQQIDDEVTSLVQKGRNGKLSVEDMNGGTFLVSNLGMYPIEEFDAIIPPGYGAALAIGSILSEPVIQNGGIQVRPVIRMTLSVDHRLVNGRLAAEFLSAVKLFLESGKFD
jgi:pyruvate dehydrogenase E2 component (dihydrolipoamide acetyltransferase)